MVVGRLRRGRESEYADFFDFYTAADNGADGKIALPVLASGDDAGEFTVDRSGPEPMIAYYDKRFPIAPGTDTGTAAEIHDRQTYRLVPWDSGLIGYRRFFTVSDLAAVRVEDPHVFDAAHAQVASWITDDLVDGIRVDHPDGLADPSDYLGRLRDLIGSDRWLVVEKVLADGEPLDATLPVDGTTGYDALNELSAVFLDPRGEDELNALSRTFTGATAPRNGCTNRNICLDGRCSRRDSRRRFGVSYAGSGTRPARPWSPILHSPTPQCATQWSRSSHRYRYTEPTTHR